MGRSKMSQASHEWVKFDMGTSKVELDMDKSKTD